MLNVLKKNITRNTLYKIYGLLLEDILNYFEIPKPRSYLKNKLHIAFKSSLGIESLTNLDNVFLSGYIELIKRYFAIELGIYLRSAREPENVRELSLNQYLKYMKKQDIYDLLNSEYNLDSYKERRRFLTDLTGANINLTIGEDSLLMQEVEYWINNN